MANRVTPLTNIETLSGNISAQTYYDNNIGPAFTALNDASLGYANYTGADTGSANNYIISAVFGAPSGYNQGMLVTFTPANSNSGASTINVNSLGAKSIVRADGAALVGGEIIAAVSCSLQFDGTNFRILALPWIPLQTNLGSISTNQTVNCKNAFSVSVVFSLTASGPILSFTNLVLGIPIFLFCTGNSSGATASFSITATQPSGAVLTASCVAATQSGTLTGFNVAASKALFASGCANGGSILFYGVQSL